jgi:hypothetical protein
MSVQPEIPASAESEPVDDDSFFQATAVVSLSASRALVNECARLVRESTEAGRIKALGRLRDSLQTLGHQASQGSWLVIGIPSLDGPGGRPYQRLADDYLVSPTRNDETVLLIPQSRISARLENPLHDSSGKVNPVFDLCIQTSLDQPLQVYDLPTPQKQPSPGTWHRFFINGVSLEVVA